MFTKLRIKFLRFLARLASKILDEATQRLRDRINQELDAIESDFLEAKKAKQDQEKLAEARVEQAQAIAMRAATEAKAKAKTISTRIDEKRKAKVASRDKRIEKLTKALD